VAAFVVKCRLAGELGPIGRVEREALADSRRSKAVRRVRDFECSAVVRP
jgi:hypothetical protein